MRKSLTKSLWNEAYHVSGKVCGYVFPNLLRKRNLTDFPLILEYMYGQSNATFNSYQFKAYWCLSAYGSESTSKLHFAHLQHQWDISDLRHAFQSKFKFNFSFSTGFHTIAIVHTATSLIIGENIFCILKLISGKIYLRSILITLRRIQIKQDLTLHLLGTFAEWLVFLFLFLDASALFTFSQSSSTLLTSCSSLLFTSSSLSALSATLARKTLVSFMVSCNSNA